MSPDRALNPEPLIYESGALPTALRGLAICLVKSCLFGLLCVYKLCVWIVPFYFKGDMWDLIY